MSNETGKDHLRKHLTLKFGEKVEVSTIVEHMLEHGLVRSRDVRAYLAREWYIEQWMEAPANGRTSAQVVKLIAEKLDLEVVSVYQQAALALRKKLRRD